MKTGIELIEKERQEQIEKHGYDSNHDDSHDGARLLCGALYALTQEQKYSQEGWEEFEEKVDSNYANIKNLIKAGALIAAEIDRLQRPVGLNKLLEELMENALIGVSQDDLAQKNNPQTLGS